MATIVYDMVKCVGTAHSSDVIRSSGISSYSLSKSPNPTMERVNKDQAYFFPFFHLCRDAGALVGQGGEQESKGTY